MDPFVEDFLDKNPTFITREDIESKLTQMLDSLSQQWTKSKRDSGFDDWVSICKKLLYLLEKNPEIFHYRDRFAEKFLARFSEETRSLPITDTFRIRLMKIIIRYSEDKEKLERMRDGVDEVELIGSD